MDRFKALVFSAVLLAGALGLSPARAEGNLTVYCSVQEEWCQLMVNEFQKATGITVAMTRKSSGETYAQVKAKRPIRRATSGGADGRSPSAGGRRRAD